MKIIKILLLAVLFTVPQVRPSEAEYKNLKQNLAIIDFENKTNFENMGSGCQDILTTILWKSDRFVLIERDKIKEILDEQNFSHSRRVSAESAIKIGKILGADYILTGGITEAGLKKDKGKTNSFVALDTRLIDVTSTQIVLAETAFGQAPDTDLNAALRTAAENLVGKITIAIDKKPWQSLVIKTDGDTLYINAGSEHGIKKGDTFIVYKQGEELIDPKTKTTVGYIPIKTGRIKIVEIHPKFSTAIPAEGGNFEKGDIVKEN